MPRSSSRSARRKGAQEPQDLSGGPSARAAGATRERANLYDEVTARIVGELEAGRVPWVQPIAEWDVRQDCITEHDKNHAVVAEFVRTGDPALERQAATALRPMLEAYLRVAYPEDFPPSTLIGPFINKCTPRAGTVTEILDQANIAELRGLKDYGNNFHHDTNPAWQTQQINGQELTNFCQRVIRFTRR